MSEDYSTAVQTAREYYNSEDADNFYSIVWGGEDIHIGWYESDDEPIETASRRTVQTMAERIRCRLDASCRVLDVGAGYGGAARYLAKRFGCQVTALNLSEAENQRNRTLNAEQSLDHLIEVVDGSFEEIPSEDAAFDVVWSQDAILHSGDRSLVLAEVARVLKPGGEFVFTDPMQADDCDPERLAPIRQRIHLETLGSPAFYKHGCETLGLSLVDFQEATQHLVRHYSRVLAETSSRQAELSQSISTDYIERMKRGLQHWIDGGQRGDLTWGVFHFVKS